MTYISGSARREWVALDLETTGLSASSDDIIEIGAVRFTLAETLGEYQTFVNPGRLITGFITDLTGITQAEVNAAPRFAEVSDGLLAFLDGATLIAHNADFDLGFLRAAGLAVDNPVCDTWELAYLARSDAPSYALDQLAGSTSAPKRRAHRALNDALAVRDVFLTLLPVLANMAPEVIDEFRSLARRSGWQIGALLDSVDELKGSTVGRRASGSSVVVDSREIGRRLSRPSPIRAGGSARPVDPGMICDALAYGSKFADRVPDFEERPQQIEMAAAITETINSSGRLIVEAGTGVGKSLAYLLPAALYATANNIRIVVSTNTINLQEQLVRKDLPMVREALRAIDPDAAEKLRFTELKGRANYLCFKRWRQMRSSGDLDQSHARLIAKTLPWITETDTGDRSELNLGHRRAASAWERLSAQRAVDCPNQSMGPCFLRAAREEAAASHIVVVNHALLLSDIVAGGSAIPDYDLLIVDEAHHLEEAATNQLGFSVGQSDVTDLLGDLMGERGLILQTVNAVHRGAIDRTSTTAIEGKAAEIQEIIPRLREELSAAFRSAAQFAFREPNRRLEFARQRLITKDDRDMEAWNALEAVWLAASIRLADLSNVLSSLVSTLDSIDSDTIRDGDRIVSEMVGVGQGIDQFKSNVSEFMIAPSDGGIYWVQEMRQSSDVLLKSAPLHVGELLEDHLYSNLSSVILTSATLNSADEFVHVIDRLGFAEAQNLELGSPFDFHASTLLYTPTDAPAPGSPQFQGHVQNVIRDAATAAGGRTMALFTSHASLRAAASALRGPMSNNGIQVLAQGVDGPPRQIAARFLEEPASVLLGTSSFWEGVDFAGDTLNVLIVVRLPFMVPDDPVFKSRSGQYENPFMQYALPQAIIRFRQGFGRLIRTSRDRGVAIVLDPRVATRRYGRDFIASLPEMRVTNGRGAPVGEIVKKWMEFAG